MKTDLFFNPTLETPAPGSLLDRYQQGQVAAHAVNWAFVCGLDVSRVSDLDALATADTEEVALCAALEVAAETTKDFPDANGIAGYGLVKALVAKASVRLGSRQQRLQAIRAAIAARLAWVIATNELRLLGYPVANLPGHLQHSGAVAVAVAGPLSRRAESRRSIALTHSAKNDSGAIVAA